MAKFWSGGIAGVFGRYFATVALVAACGEDAPPAADDGEGVDPPPVDASGSSPFDSGSADAAPPDAGLFDASPSPDATLLPELAVERRGFGSGTVSAPGLIECGEQCTASLPPGTIVTLTAVPAPGSAFVGWDSLDSDAPSACGDEPVCDVQVDGWMVVSAEFQHIVSVTVSVEGPGEIVSTSIGDDPLSCPSDCEATSVLPEQFTLSPQPRLGCLLDHWSGDCAGQEQFCSPDIPADGPTAFAARAHFVQMVEWTRQVGGLDPDDGLDVATSAAGDIAVVGAADLNVWVSLRSSTGVLRFSRTFDTSPFVSIAEAVAFDPEGNVVVAGRFGGTIDFGAGPLTTNGNYDIFLAAFTPDGEHLWSQTWGDASWQQPRALEIAADGSILLAGTFEGTLSFGTTVLTSVGEGDSFAALLGPDREERWATRWGNAAGDQSIFRVLPLADGGAVLLGQVEAPPLRLLRVDDEGVEVWSAPLQGGLPAGLLRWNEGFGLARAPSGDLVVSTVSSTLGDRTFLARYTMEGALVQQTSFTDVEVYDLAVDSTGEVALVGIVHTGGNVGRPLFVRGGADLLLAKLDQDFRHLWSFAFGDGNTFTQHAARAAIGAGDTVVFCGHNSSVLDMGTGPMDGSFRYDVVIGSFRQ